MPEPAVQRLADRFDPRVLAMLSGLDLKARYLVEGFLSGLHDSPYHGFSVEFSEYRDYQPGDDPRHVDWRLYARSDRLCVKQYRQETNCRFYLLCDSSGSMAYRGRNAWGSKIETAQVLAAALTWMLLKQNDAVGLLTYLPGDDIPDYIRPSQKPSQFGLLMRHLEMLRPAGGERLPRLLAHALRLVHRRSVLILISDLLEPAAALQSWLQQMRFYGHECLVIQVLDGDEIDFPFEQPCVFEDLETTSQRYRVSPSEVRQRYLERFQAFMDEHRELLQSLEMTHCLLRTDEPPWKALALFLAKRRQLL